MKAMQITQYGPEEKVKLVEIPKPTVQSTEVLVEVYAASVNPVDYKLRDGALKRLRTHTFPITLGNDFAGVVSQVGAEVKNFKVGDKVYGAASSRKWGSFAEYFAIDQKFVALMPNNLTFKEAATLPLVSLTAYQGLKNWLSIQPGQKIFIPGGAGGVGVVAIPLAKHLGATVATTGSPAGEALINKLGADIFINYRSEKFQTLLNDYDAVFDLRGGEDLINSFSILKPGGKIASIAGMPDYNFAKRENLTGMMPLVFRLISRKITKLAKKQQVTYNYFLKTASGKDLSEITKLVEAGVIKPVIDREFTLAETQAALDFVETGRTKGKVVIAVK